MIFFITCLPSDKLDLSYCYTEREFPVERLQSKIFKPTDYLCSFSKEGNLWIEAEIPETIKGRDLDVVTLGIEPIYEATLFVQTEDLAWKYVGKTGNGVRMPDKSISTNLYAFKFNGAEYRTEKNKRLKIRIRITSTVDSVVTVSLMNEKIFNTMQNAYTAKTFFLLGICLMMIIYIIFNCITIREYSSIYLLIMGFLLVLEIMIKAGIPGAYFFPLATINKIFSKTNYFIICASGALVCLAISSVLKNEFRQNPEWLSKLDNFSVYFYVIIFTIGMAITSIPIPYHFIKHIEFIAFTLCLADVALFNIATIKFSKLYRKGRLISMDAALLIIWFEHLILTFRFNPNASKIFTVFDNKQELPLALAFFIIGILTIIHIDKRLRQKLAYLQVRTGEVEEKISESKKWSFIYNNLTNMIANPLQSICNKVEKNREFIPQDEYSILKRSILSTMKLTNAISILSIYEHSPKEILFDSEPVNLNTLIPESISPELSTLRINGCFPKLSENYSDGSYVLTNKALLTVALKFVLQTVIKRVHPKTAVNITSEYENFTFIFTVYFECEHISSDLKRILLHLEGEDSEDRSVSTVIEEWGIQLYIAKKIVSLLKGSLGFTPGINRAVIQIRLALKPLSSQSAGGIGYDETDFEEDDDKAQTFICSEKPEFDQDLFIVEEESSLRNDMYSIFKKSFRTKIFANTQEFEKALEETKPDCVLFSLSTPGTHLLELLEKNKKLQETPVLVMTKFISKTMTNKLYEKGVFEVVQKPFDISVMTYRITSMLLSRIKYREKILSSITDSLRNGLLQKPEQLKKNGSQETSGIFADHQEEILETLRPKDNPELIMNAIFVSANLTKKECAIARLIAAGKTDKEISAELKISTGTVAVHNKNIYKKLDVHSRKELAEKVHKQ